MKDARMDARSNERDHACGACANARRRRFLSSIMPFPPSSPVHDIERRILALEHELAQLKRRRNAYAPIFVLPDELLVAIFKYTQFQADYDASDSHDWAWYMATTACVHFWSLAKRTPALWNVLDFTQSSSAWADLCVQRSRGALLHIRDEEERGAHLLPHARVYEYEGTVASEQLLGQPAPDLQVLHLEIRNRSAPMTPAFLGGSNVNLVHLYLSGGSMHLAGAPPMLRLRHLELRGIQTDPDLRALCQLFANTPQLEVLHMDIICLSHPRDSVDANVVIPVPSRAVLPHLQTLIINDAVAEASAFLRLLPPPALRLYIQVLNIPDDVPLVRNHALVLEAYLAFVQTLPDRADLTTARMTATGDAQSSISFGHAEVVSEELLAGEHTDPVAFLGVVYTSGQPASHPILDAVNKLTAISFVLLRDIWQFLPNARRLVLSQWATMPPQSHALDWFRQRPGVIQHVSFYHCVESVMALAEALRQEGIVGETEWVAVPRMRNTRTRKFTARKS
jgi:hypothetical protein